MALKSNRQEIQRELRSAIDTRLEQSGFVVENAAKQLSPIDTGRLRASLTHYKEGNTVYIGTNVTYGVYQELGTRHMPPQPYLRPGLNNSRGALAALWGKPIQD